MQHQDNIFEVRDEVLKAILMEPESSDKAIREIVEWHKANKPSMLIIKRKFQEFLDKEDHMAKAFGKVDQVLGKLLTCKASLGVIRAYLTLLKQNSESVRGETEKVRPYWKKLNIDHLEIFFGAFDLRDSITKQELEAYVKELIVTERFDDCKNLIKLFGSSTALIHELLSSMGTNRTASKAASFIKEMNIDQNQFPEINRRLSKKCLRYFLKSEGWQYVQQLYESNFDMVAFTIEDLIFNGKIDQAMTFYTKYLDDKPNSIQKPQTMLKVRELQQSKNFKILPNFLFDNTQFGPSNVDRFLSLKTWGFSAEDVVWIDKQTPDIEQKLRPFLQAKMIGIDTESLVGLTKLEQPQDGVALIQLATDNYLVLIDCLNLPLDIIAPFFRTILTNRSIYKVGHTLGDDLKNVCQALRIQKSAQGLIDVQKIFKGITGQKHSNLSHISKRILGKEICKIQTLTNWGRRPLRPSQVHYACMDAFVVIKIYEQMLNKYGQQYVRHFMDEEELKEQFEYSYD